MDRTEQAKHVRRLMDELEEGAVAVATYTVTYRCPDCGHSFVGSRKRRELLRHYVACHQESLLVRWGRYAPADGAKFDAVAMDRMAAQYGKVSMQPLQRELHRDYYSTRAVAGAQIDDRLLGEGFERWDGFWAGAQVLPDELLAVLDERGGELETLEVAVQATRIQLAAALSALATPDPAPVARPEPKVTAPTTLELVAPVTSHVRPKVDRATKRPKRTVIKRSKPQTNGAGVEAFRDLIAEIAMEEVEWLSSRWGAKIPRELAPKFAHLFKGELMAKYKIRNKAQYKKLCGKSAKRLGLLMNDRRYGVDVLPTRSGTGGPSPLGLAIESLEEHLETLVPRDGSPATLPDGGEKMTFDDSRWVAFDCSECGMEGYANDWSPLWAARWCPTCKKTVWERAEVLDADDVRDLLEFMAQHHRMPGAPDPSPATMCDGGQPTTLSQDEIKRTARRLGLKSEDLLLLARKNSPRWITPSKRAAAEFGRDVWATYATATGRHVSHVRGLHYFASDPPGLPKPNGDHYANTFRDWGYINEALKAARYLELIPMTAIVDNRSPQQHYVAYSRDELVLPTLDAIIGTVVWSLTNDCRASWSAWTRRKESVVVFCEKTTVSYILEGPCRRLGAAYCPGQGQATLTAVREMLSWARRHQHTCRVLVISDWDAAGACMPTAISAKLAHLVEREGGSATVEQIALTEEQVDHYKLPPMFTRTSDPMSGVWKTRHGGRDERVELDALEARHPGALEVILRHAILESVDIEAEQRIEDASRRVADEVRARAEELADELRAPMTKMVRELELTLLEAIRRHRPDLDYDAGYDTADVLYDSSQPWLANIKRKHEHLGNDAIVAALGD